MIGLRCKRALVTGGSRSIVAAITQVSGEDGADIAITYQNSPGRANSVVFLIEKLGRVGSARHADTADPDAVERALNETVASVGGLDNLVNKVAIGPTGATADLNLKQFRALMDVYVPGHVASAQAAIPRLHNSAGLSTI